MTAAVEAVGLLAEGRAVRLGKRIGKGGEGEVFAVEGRPADVAKIYDAAGAARREAKIEAMVAARLCETTPFVAFPRAVLRDGRGAFAGFLMPRVEGAEPLHEVYAPGARKRRFPEADYRFLVRVAANVARAVAATHAAGCVIGDVNHSSFLIARDGLVTLIDADSFQFRDGETLHTCHVGVPEYTAPELHGASLAGVERTANHDAFALAVVVFQLLFMGRHPFAGVSSAGDVTVPEAIAGHRFAWSRRRETGLSPPAGLGSLGDVPAPVAALFEEAFAPEGETARPSAARWAEALAAMEEALRPCANSLRHHYPQGADACPWCRMEAASGTPLFLLPGEYMAGEAVAAAEIPLPAFDEDGWRARLAAVEAPERFVYDPPTPPIEAPIALPKRPPWQGLPRLLGGLSLLGLAAANLAIIPQNWLLSVPTGLGGIAYVRDWRRPDRPAREELMALDARLSRALLRVQAGVELDRAYLLKAEMEARVAERAALPERLAEIARGFQEERLAAQRQRFLERIRLAQASVPGVAPERLRRLSETGMATAADVLAGDPAASGVLEAGEAAALRDWAREQLARFRPDPGLAPDERTALARRQADLANRARRIDGELESETARLERLAKTIADARTATDPAIEDLLVRRAVLVHEIETLGGTAKARPTPAPKTVSEEAVRRARAIRAGAPS